MSTNSEPIKANETLAKTGTLPPEKTCFVIMPIADTPGYDAGHFSRVYEYILKPAIIAANLKPIRADEVKKTNYIVVDILRKLLDSDVVLCDISGRNPNVLFELGIGQAFNRPVCLVKDHITDHIFDIQGLRYTSYESTLRVDVVKKAINEISQAIKETLAPSEHDVNSLLDLLSIKPASLPSKKELGQETSILLAAINSLSAKVNQFEKAQATIQPSTLLQHTSGIKIKRLDGSILNLSAGDSLWGPGNETVTVYSITDNYVLIQGEDGSIKTVYFNTPEIDDYSHALF